MAGEPRMSLEAIDSAPMAEMMNVDDYLSLETAYEVIGSNLIPKAFLLGVPLLVTGIRFQRIEIPEKGPNKGIEPRGYITCEAMVYPADYVERQLSMGRIIHYMGGGTYETPEK